MSDDSETVEDAKKGSLAEVTDDSCTLEYIEIVPLDRPSDDYHTSEFISPVVEVKPEDLQEMKQEPADENDNEDSHCYVKQEPADENDNEDSHCYVKQEPADENDNEDSHCYVKQEPAVGYGIIGSCFTIQVSSFTFTFMFHLFPGHGCPHVEQFTVICHIINHRRHC